MGIREALTSVEHRVREACTRAGRERSSVTLVAVSKTVDAAAVQEAIPVGQFTFGENYVQEAKKKYDALDADARGSAKFHLIGNLQRNKAQLAVELFDVIQTVDRIELARALNNAAAKKGSTQDVLIQVNISAEESKSGIKVEHLRELSAQVLSLDHLKLQGLMCIGSYIPEDAADDLRRSEFRRMFAIRKEMEETFARPFPELSMGMSHDFELAIEEGATIIRVGTAIFGERKVNANE